MERMLQKGVQEKRWSEKFVSEVKFTGDYLVAVFPDVYQVDLGVDASNVLLASDGLWDYMNSTEAVNFVREQLKKHGDAQMACEALGQSGSWTDDKISIVIADLGFITLKCLSTFDDQLQYECLCRASY